MAAAASSLSESDCDSTSSVWGAFSFSVGENGFEYGSTRNALVDDEATRKRGE
jgi:hypothetical protein